MLFVSLLFAQEPELKFNKMQLDYVKEHNPELLETYNAVMQSKKNREKRYAFFLFLSSDTPTLLTETFSKSLHNINRDNVEYGVFFQGLDKNVYKYINDATVALRKRPSNSVVDVSFQFDPDYFVKNSITRVPLMALSLCDEGNYYPSECETLYTIRGTSNVEFFIEKIVEDDRSYDGVFRF